MGKHIWMRIVSVVMSFVVVVTMLPAVAFGATIVASGYCGGEGNGENLKWELDSEGTLTIRGEGEMADYGFGQTNPAPWRERDIKKVYISEGVTSIGKAAFYECDSLTDITIPNSVISTGTHAFFSCINLATIVLPNGLTSVSDFMFANCNSLVSITIPDGVTSIGKNAFPYCWNLTSISIPDSVTSIGNDAFYGCHSLTGITLPSSITSIGDSTLGFCNSLTNIIIPNSVTSIGEYAFSYCNSLTVITIPQSVTSIGKSAFESSKNLTDVYYFGSEDEWDKISIGLYNDPLTSATIHYNSTGPIIRDSVRTVRTDSIALTVYGNQCDSSNRNTRYSALADAKAESSLQSALTNEKGQVAVSYSGDGITVSKDGYVSRTLTENQINESREVYLQKESAYPVISAVWMDNSCDIMNTEKTMPLVQSTSHTVRAEVSWGRSSMKTLKLAQGTVTIDISDSSNTSIKWSDYFDLSREILIVATNTNGKTTTKTLKLTYGNQIVKETLSGMSLNLGDSLGFTLPNNLPIIGGMRMGLGVYSPVPVSYSIDNGKVYLAIGYQTDLDDDPGSASGIKEYVDIAKIMRESISKPVEEWKRVTKRLAAAKAFGGHVEGTWGVDCGFDIVGFYEGYIDEDGNIRWLDGGVIIGANGGISYSQPFSIGIVPCYAEVELSAEATAKLNLLISEKLKNITPDGVVNGSISLDIGAGVGVKKFATAGGGLTGTASAEVIYSDAALSSAQVRLGLAGYLKATCLWFEKEWPIDIAEKVVYEYPDPASYANSVSRPAMMSAIYDAANYHQPVLSGLAESSSVQAASTPARFAGNVSTDGVSTFQTNTYQQATPQMISLADGSLLAVWIGYNSTRSGMDALCLHYATYTDGVWSSPSVLDDDDTMDCAFTLRMVNGQPWVVWQDANAPISASDTLNDVAAKMDISVAYYKDGQFYITPITGETADGLDTMPTVCGSGEDVCVAWMNNSSNNPFANDGTGVIRCRTLSGEAWGAVETLYSGINALDSLDAIYGADGLQVYYAMDTDGDITTNEDTEIFCNGNRITENSTLDSGVRCQGEVLYYYADGTLMANGTEEIPATSQLTSDVYQMVDIGEDKVLLFLTSNGYYNTLYGIFYDNTSDKWGKPVALTGGVDYISSFSAAPTTDGLQVLINRLTVSEPDESGNPYGQAQIDLLHLTLGCDLTVDDVDFDATRYVSGYDLPMTIRVTNNGRVAVGNVRITVLDGGTTLYDSTVKTDLLAGKTQNLDIALPIKTAVQDKTITVSVEAVEGTERNVVDNSKAVTLSYRDIALENMGCGLDESGNTIIYADVVNRGYSDSDAVTVSLHKDSAESAAIESITTGALASFDLQRINFVTPVPEDGALYILTIDSIKDDNPADDSSFIYTPAARVETGVMVSGSITGVKDSLIMVTFSSTNQDGKTYQIGTDADGSFSLDSIPSGSYIMTAYASGYVSRETRITVSDSPVVALTTSLVSRGDINGTGNLDATDMQCLYAYLSTDKVEGGLKNELSYFTSVADVNNDGEVNILDYQALYTLINS